MSESDLLNLDQTLVALEYIANSPAQEHGGFHPNTVIIAKSALKHLKNGEPPELRQEEISMAGYEERRVVLEKG